MVKNSQSKTSLFTKKLFTPCHTTLGRRHSQMTPCVIGYFRVAFCLRLKTSPSTNHSNENEFDLHENGHGIE